MPDVKQFNILGEIIKVKDNVARNIDVSSASVALFGTTTAYYFNKSKVMLEKYPDMKILDYTESDSTFVSTYMRKLKEIDLYNAADYCVIWFGDEDITENVDWGIPEISTLQPNASYYDETTTFGALNYMIAMLKSVWSTTKIIGIINSDTYIDASKYRFFYGNICNIYRKWNVPIINLNDIINFSTFVGNQKREFYSSDTMLNLSGNRRIRDILCSIMSTGSTCTSNIDYNDIYVQTNENIEVSPNKWIDYVVANFQPFNSNPNNASNTGCITIINKNANTQRIICVGTFYGASNGDGKFVGLYRTLGNSALHYYDSDVTTNNAFISSVVPLSAGTNVLPELRKGRTLAIDSKVYPKCTNLPHGYSGSYPDITITGTVDSTGDLNTFAWASNGDIWTGKSAAGAAFITWEHIVTYTQITAGINVLTELRNGKNLSIPRSLYNSCSNLPAGYSGTFPDITITGAVKNDVLNVTAWTSSGDIWTGSAAAEANNITWYNVSSNHNYISNTSTTKFAIATESSVVIDFLTIPESGYYLVLGMAEIEGDTELDLSKTITEATLNLAGDPSSDVSVYASGQRTNTIGRCSLIKRFNKGDVVNFRIYASRAAYINRTTMQAYRLSLI